MFPRDSEYNYSDCRLFVIGVDEGKDLSDPSHVHYYLGAKSYFTRDTYVEVMLPAGTYYVFVEVDWNENAMKLVNNHCCVTCYGASKIDFVDVSSKFKRDDVARAACQAILAKRSSEKAQQVIKMDISKY